VAWLAFGAVIAAGIVWWGRLLAADPRGSMAAGRAWVLVALALLVAFAAVTLDSVGPWSPCPLDEGPRSFFGVEGGAGGPSGNGGSPALPLWTHAMSVVGDWKVLLPACVAMLCLGGPSTRRRLWPWLVAIVGVALSVYFLKIATARPRPPDALLRLKDKAFPSGHAAIPLVFFALVGSELRRRIKGRGWLASLLTGVALLLLVLAIALSRLVLRVHWPTDVLAGLLLGLFWAGLAGLETARRVEPAL
jgi:membrane-associated phospholipid phosphatase